MPFLNHLNIGRCFRKGVVRTGIKPSESSAQGLYLQFLILQEPLVHGGNLQLPTCRRLDMFGYIHHFIRIEIKPDYRIVGFWLFRLFLNGEAITSYIKLSYTIAFRIINPIAKYRRLLFLLGNLHSFFQHSRKTVSMKDIIT